MLDVAHGRRQGTFVDRGNACFHLGRNQAVVGPDDADYRNIDGGKDVDRRPQESDGRDQEQEQRKHDECVGSR